VAGLFELVGLGLTLLMTGRLAEHDTLVTGLVERYRVNGPPTCLNWALTMLGTSASLQGQHHVALRYLDEAAGVAVPDRTHTLKNPLEARAALRLGDRSRAFQILRTYVGGLLDNDDIYMAEMAFVEFVNMMARVDHLTEAATVLGHLERSGMLDGALPYRALVADAVSAIATKPDLTLVEPPSPALELDDRRVLEYMLEVLDQLGD
jgi:hypothetical protein